MEERVVVPPDKFLPDVAYRVNRYGGSDKAGDHDHQRAEEVRDKGNAEGSRPVSRLHDNVSAANHLLEQDHR